MKRTLVIFVILSLSVAVAPAQAAPEVPGQFLTAHGNDILAVVPDSDSVPVVVASAPGEVLYLDATPDLSRIATVTFDDELFISTDGGPFAMIPIEAGYVREIRWSADGRRLAILGERDDPDFGFSPATFVYDTVDQTVTATTGVHAVGWSPDGSLLYGTDDGSTLVSLDWETGDVTPIALFEAIRPIGSAANTYAWLSHDEVIIAELDGNTLVESVAYETPPYVQLSTHELSVSPDTSHVAYASERYVTTLNLLDLDQREYVLPDQAFEFDWIDLPSTSGAVVTTGLFDGNPATIERVGNLPPVEATVELSQLRFPNGANTAVLAQDGAFADALAGSVLTGDSPLLVTDSLSLDAAVRTELNRVLPAGAPVLLLGGTAALSAEIAQTLEADGFAPQRLAGPTRVETALEIADYVTGDGPRSTAFLARADEWADSIAVGPYLSETGVPVLLTATDDLHPAVSAWLAEHNVEEITILGGEAAISQATQAAVGLPATRLQGPERAATAAAIAAALYDLDGSSSYQPYIVIDGDAPDSWIYGLAGAGAGADADAPLVMTRSGEVPPATAALLGGCTETRSADLMLIGPDARFPAALIDTLASLHSATC